MSQVFTGRSNRTAAVIPFPLRARPRGGALEEAVRSHRLPEALHNALLADIVLSGMDGLKQAIARRLQPAPIDLAKTRTIILFGPSGSGKSRTAGKIAQAARALGRNARIVSAAKGMEKRSPSRKSLVIADCAGFNPHNAKARAAFAALSDLPHALTIGVVSALSDAEEISEIVAAFAMRHVIVTGLDMTRRAGALAAAALQGARLAHVVRGDGLENLSAGDLAARLAAKAGIH
jgi:flagellar biosynthesis protein FlhF